MVGLNLGIEAMTASLTVDLRAPASSATRSLARLAGRRERCGRGGPDGEVNASGRRPIRGGARALERAAAAQRGGVGAIVSRR